MEAYSLNQMVGFLPATRILHQNLGLLQMLDLTSVKFRKQSQNYFVTKFHPRFNEVDSYKVVWNGHYVNYFEEARTSLCRNFGISLDALADLGFYLPVYKYNVTMRKPIFLDDEMHVCVRPNFTNPTVFEFQHLIMVKDEVRVTGSVQQVALSKETGQIMFELPKEVLKFLTPLYEAFTNG